MAFEISCFLGLLHEAEEQVMVNTFFDFINVLARNVKCEQRFQNQ